MSAERDLLHRLLAEGDGVLRCDPAWVARDFLPPGRRLGLPEDAYDVGERGSICERWLASTTRADNRVGPDDEGLSRVVGDRGEHLLLRDAVAADPAAVLGASYAATHPGGLGRLAKIFDYAYRLPYHVHPPQELASLVGCRAKDESYHFLPGVDLGRHPETFFGVHPWIGEQGAHEVLLPYLVDWDSDLILRHARAELQVSGEGFHVPSGVLHAPGTALTLELQEDSDVLSMFQALNAGRIISKELLFKDVRPEDRVAEGERFPLRFVDWEVNADPWFYENRHLTPQPVADAADPGDGGAGEESWVFYNTTKYAGKRLRIPPGGARRLCEPGVYSVFVWSGTGTLAGHEVRGGEPGRDELVVTHEAATREHELCNTGAEDLVVFTFFGPDLHAEVPRIPTSR
ncbi:hypothetical protein GGQ22_11855 [Nocardioides sp. zg-579]|uniref:Cupin domain-containing protein n=1 Tax=Nocardioides marmotae TaxID=2663857 RepID=A0A6I3JCC7_9ACTN|nr:hypothetical protein [Nocardioides marmotae]MCR6032131.1 hypothetical protein [Gordonia jinghuaiqii]MTB95777.1 hypothetical protein [Nocardioides marmotae]QKE02863.1 hypothetical protein HPC71_18670 [Nocardioides marmotae]